MTQNYRVQEDGTRPVRLLVSECRTWGEEQTNVILTGEKWRLCRISMTDR